MKKMLIVALALGLVVALAVPAMATDWSARGHIFVGGAIHRTVPPAGPPQFGYVPPATITPTGDGWNDTFSWVRMGANLTITARQSEDLYGVLGFNMNSDRWGEQSWNDSNNMGSWYRESFAFDNGTLSVLINEAFIDFRVPPKLPIWLRIGSQPFVIRPWLLVNTVGPGLTGRIMIDPIKLGINIGWAKKWEGYDWDTDDVDAFFADIAMPIGPVRVGGFVWYENFGEYPSTAGPPPTTFPGDDSGARNEADLYWFGFYADGKIGPVGFQFDWIYGGGEIDGNPLATNVIPDQDVESWVIRGVVDVSPMPRLLVGVGGLYATGEDFSTTDAEEFCSVNTREGAGRQQGLPALQDFILLTDGVMGIVPFRGPGVGYVGGPNAIGGFWYVRGFAQYMATDWLRLVANFGWIGDTRDDWNRIPGMGGAREAPFGPNNLRDDDDVGFELDFGFNIALYKNLQWGVGFGYLFAGDALDMWDTASLTNEAPNDPWALTSAILYTF
jgi:hypothetical protein